MKRYEAPVVELTKFDVEDVITTSVMNLDQAARAEAVADIKVFAGTASEGAEDAAAYGNNIFAW